MKKTLILTVLASLGLSLAAQASSGQGAIGVVNFATCITESKHGKKEQENYEALKKQMATLLEDADKQLRELGTKLNDPEYLDGLSPEAEQELKIKIHTLQEEAARYQNQYYQVMNQANMRMVQTMSANINAASEKVAKEKKLDMVLNKEAFFFHNNQLDVTTNVIKEMDKKFDEEAKTQAVNNAPKAVEPVKTTESAKAAEAAKAQPASAGASK